MVLFITIDYFTKYMATTYLKPVGRMDFIPGLELVYAVNEGVAFSMFTGSCFFVIFLPIATLLVLIVLLFLGKLGGGVFDFCFVMIISGGIGNIIDRLMYGYVVDFFNFTFINFAVFNVADCFITVGVFLYSVCLIVTEVRSRKKSDEKIEESVETD